MAAEAAIARNITIDRAARNDCTVMFFLLYKWPDLHEVKRGQPSARALLNRLVKSAPWTLLAHCVRALLFHAWSNAVEANRADLSADVALHPEIMSRTPR